MSYFSFDLKDEEFDIECPECGFEFTFNGRDINHSVTCPSCNTSIHLDGKEFMECLGDIEDQINHLFD